MATDKHDWTAADAMTEADIHAAAMSDPDARPLTEEQMERVRLNPRIKVLRQTFRLSYEAFSQRYHIPAETLRAWEERRAEPTPAEEVYLHVIARAPDVVHEAIFPLVAETAVASEKHDWTLADAMTDEEIHAAALSDPDAQPLTEERLKRMRRVPRIKSLRRAFRLSYEAFAQHYHIPAETLRAWEERRAEPTEAEEAYLKVIARAPDAVRKALEPRVIETV